MIGLNFFSSCPLCSPRYSPDWNENRSQRDISKMHQREEWVVLSNNLHIHEGNNHIRIKGYLLKDKNQSRSQPLVIIFTNDNNKNGTVNKRGFHTASSQSRAILPWGNSANFCTHTLLTCCVITLLTLASLHTGTI